MTAKHIHPAVYLPETVDPSFDGEIAGIHGYADTDDTIVLTIAGQQYPIIVFDADDLAALTNLLNPQKPRNPLIDQLFPEPDTTTYADADLPHNTVAYYHGRVMLDLREEPPAIGARAATTQAIEHIDRIDTLLDIIWPDHNIAATAEEYISSLLSMLQTRLAAIEDGLVTNHQSPIPSPHNAILPEQEDAPS